MNNQEYTVVDLVLLQENKTRVISGNKKTLNYIKFIAKNNPTKSFLLLYFTVYHQIDLQTVLDDLQKLIYNEKIKLVNNKFELTI
jgi:hypothetical protein